MAIHTCLPAARGAAGGALHEEHPSHGWASAEALERLKAHEIQNLQLCLDATILWEVTFG